MPMTCLVNPILTLLVTQHIYCQVTQTVSKTFSDFQDTKLGRLRFGAPTSGVIDENFFRNYWITILYLVINIALLVTGIVILIKLDLYYVGWITIGVWILLTVFGVTASISFCYKRMNTFRRNDVEMNNQVCFYDNTPTYVRFDFTLFFSTNFR